MVGHLHTKIGEVSIIAQPNGGSFPQVLTFAPIKILQWFLNCVQSVFLSELGGKRPLSVFCLLQGARTWKECVFSGMVLSGRFRTSLDKQFEPTLFACD
jgi:hypothetical protein